MIQNLAIVMQGESSIRRRIARCCFAFMVLAWVVGLSLHLGRDLNWDFLNYHFYGPYLMLENRLRQDYFAGSLQSYLNPLSHVPQYLMIRAGWNGILVSSLLAALHALNLLFVWLITALVLPASESNRNTLPAMAVVLALLAPLFVTTAGSSFADPTTSIGVLASIWLLLRITVRSEFQLRTVALAGLLLGLASGLKLTNAVLAVAVIGAVSAAWALKRVPHIALSVLTLVAGCAIGFVLMHGYWSWRLWETFGNPFFPLFNSIFASPDFPSVTYRDTRFLGSGWEGLLTLPFQMMLPTTWLYAENAPVDLRFAVFVLVLGLASILVILSHANMPLIDPRRVGSGLALLTTIFLCAYVVWGLSSRIGRYALPIWLLLGPLVVAWLHKLFCRRDLVILVCSVIVAFQGYALLMAGNPRWTPTEWESQWLEVKMPPELKERPFTVLTLTSMSYSAIVPFIHRDARVVNLVGQYIQPSGSRMTMRLREILSVSSQDIRVVFKDRRQKRAYAGSLAASTREDVDSILSVYGLKLTEDDCSAISIPARHMAAETAEALAERARQGIERIDVDRLHACRVVRIESADYARIQAQRDRMAKAFDAVEAACGSALSPQGTELLRGRLGWMRTYFNSLHNLITDGEHIYIRPFRSMVDIDLGGLQLWSGPGSPACPTLPATIDRPE